MLITLFGIGLPQLWAGSNTWTSIGPFGGSIHSLAIDPQHPSTLYAGTPSGIFKSMDGGTSWSSINSDIIVHSLAIDPRSSSTLYASSLGSGVVRSTDGGIHWSAASSGLPLWDVRALAIDPQNSSTLYVGTGRGLFKSVDAGASWNAAGNGLPTLPIRVGTRTPTNVDRLVIDPQNPTTVYANASVPLEMGTSIVCCSEGLFKTTDGGANWYELTLPVGRQPSSGLPYSVLNLVIDPQNPTTLYAPEVGGPPALFKSTDGGATWSTINSSIAISALAVNPQDSNTLYASTLNGVLKSVDAGLSWTSTTSGLPGGVVSLVIDPQQPTIVYASGGISGVFKTSDGGANWTATNSGLSTLWIPTLAIDPQSSTSIYAGSGWMGTVFVKNANFGSDWIPANSEVPSFYPFVLVIDPQNPSTLYAGTNAGDFGPDGRVFKSTDRGRTWSSAMSGLPGNLSGVNALAIDPKNPNTIYAGTDQGLLISLNGAGSWNLASGLPAHYISAVVVDAQTPTTIYVSGDGALFKTTNSGSEWNKLDFPKGAGVLAIDPKNSNTLYAGSVNKLFKTTDAGTSWSETSTGLPKNQNGITALVIDPQNPSTLYLATNGEGFDSCSIPCSGFDDGVFKSTDAGTTWTALNDGLTTPHVSTLAIDPDNPNRLYAGTQGGGVFAITFGPAPTVSDFRFDRTNVVAGGSYSVTISGSNLTTQTFFDVRVTAPGSGTSDVVLNWQKGLDASHDVPAGIAAGTWTVTGVRAHEIESDHIDTFVPVSATITVLQ